jgi:hypothetical protein
MQDRTTNKTLAINHIGSDHLYLAAWTIVRQVALLGGCRDLISDERGACGLGMPYRETLREAEDWSMNADLNLMQYTHPHIM